MIKKILEVTILTTISILMVLLVVLVSSNVVMRYLFNNSLIFSEELSRYTMIWLGLIGSSYVFIKNQHTAFILIKEKICRNNKNISKIYDVVLQLIIIGFASLVFVGGVFLVHNNFSQVSAILQWKMGYVYLCVPISMFLIVVFQIMNVVDTLKKRTEK